MVLECKKCHASIIPEFIANHEYEYSFNRDEESLHSYSPSGKYEFWHCPNCQSPFLTQEDDESGFTVLYPPKENPVNANLPARLKSAYSEAISCFNSRAYTATAVMCRKTLEGICGEHGAKGNNLVQNLKELRDKGIIENRLFEWADALRISGNEAAHDLAITTSSEDARDILEFTSALLEYVFTFRDKFEKFKKRRSIKSGN